MKPIRAFIDTTIDGILSVVDRLGTFSTRVFGTKHAGKFSFLCHIFKLLQLNSRAFYMQPTITLVTLNTVLPFKAQFGTISAFIRWGNS